MTAFKWKCVQSGVGLAVLLIECLYHKNVNASYSYQTAVVLSVKVTLVNNKNSWRKKFQSYIYRLQTNNKSDYYMCDFNHAPTPIWSVFFYPLGRFLKFDKEQLQSR